MTRSHSTGCDRRAAGSRSPGGIRAHRRVWTAAVSVGALLAVVLWSYWPVVAQLWREWSRDPNYSVGQLVPLAALYLLWHERGKLRGCGVLPCWWGLAALLLAQAARFLGLLFVYESAERYSLVLTIAALVLLVAGRQVFWRVRWILVFLALMIPLPGRVHNAVSGPLQEWASSATVFVLELFGTYVTREGNILTLNGNTPIGIAEACSGLRMLTAFVVVSAVLAFLVNRPRWQRAVLVLSSIPIAIVCNVARVIATIALHLHVSSATADVFFHDFAGVSMMPLAIATLLAELWLIDKLTTPDAVTALPKAQL